jgi:hypothetical protein
LRSLEQRSPLNIYVNEADKNFNLMRKNVAIGCVSAINKFYVNGANTKLFEILKKEYPTMLNENYKDINLFRFGSQTMTINGNNKTSLSGLNNDAKIKMEQLIAAQKAKAEQLRKQNLEASVFEKTKLEKSTAAAIGDKQTLVQSSHDVNTHVNKEEVNEQIKDTEKHQNIVKKEHTIHKHKTTTEKK